ncbi:MAG: hypothetical protein FWC34_08145 [Bacteroidetes bacterium]|nr:hypothetical protein [Bacteroidota bacterium]MCL2301670.1 hypothetical protein [Lentimicrobiaceae bacterium]
MKNIFCLFTLIGVTLFFQSYATAQGVKGDKFIPGLKSNSYICDYETIPKDNPILISTEYNTGVLLESIVTHLDDSIKSYVDLVTSQILHRYGADAILALTSEMKTNEKGEIIIIVKGYPVKWTNFRPITEFYKEKTSLKSRKCAPENGFGLDLGIGSTTITANSHLYNFPSFALGFRYLHYFDPYFGADFLKINFSCPFRAQREYLLMNFQFMTGIRGKSPAFYKCMSAYGALRLGYGFRFLNTFDHGIAFETELGLNLTRTVFIAFSYNLLSLFVDHYYLYSDFYNYRTPGNINFHTYAFRVGFNLGK